MKLCCWVDVWPGAKPEQCIAIGIAPTYPPLVGGKRYRVEFELPDPAEIIPVDAVITKSLCHVEEERDVNSTK